MHQNPRCIVITGAASGFGKAFTGAYIAHPDTRVIALDRAFKSNYATSTSQKSAFFKSSLRAAGDESSNVDTDDQATMDRCYARLTVYGVDVTDEADIASLSQLPALREFAVDLVIHSAGVRGLAPDKPLTDQASVIASETLEATTVDTLRRTLEVNAVGTFALLQALIPRLAPGAKVVVMGSRMGSIASNTAGGGYAYRASKAALNAIVKSLAIEVPQVIWTIFHPGRVETGLVAVKEEGAMAITEVLGGIMDLIDGLQAKDSGRFLDRFGEDIPW